MSSHESATLCARTKPGRTSPGLSERIIMALHSRPMQNLRSSLARVGADVEPAPIVHKYLPGGYLRLMFPVSTETIEDGAIVAVAVLHDCNTETTLYAHPMHAGPAANPLMKYVDAPMANPASQQGKNGERATQRFLEHKRALWAQFYADCRQNDAKQAGLAWRNGFHWALRRLYFCERCAHCPWGSPFFDPAGSAHVNKSVTGPFPKPLSPLTQESRHIIETVTAGHAWQNEERYVQRGGWDVAHEPVVIQRHHAGLVWCAFPTNARLLQPGTIVALLAVFHEPTSRMIHTQALVAGPETEILLRHGKALGLGIFDEAPAARRALRAYIRWREAAWTRFWLNELQHGIDYASQAWLSGFYVALDTLLQKTNQAQ